MMKRLICMLLVATMLWCTVAMADTAKKAPQWNDRSTWVFYDGRLNCRLDDGTEVTFVAEYRRANIEENTLMCFWLAYVPEGHEPGDPYIWIALGDEDHGLVLEENGFYRLLIRETAMQKAYETWEIFNAE